MTPENLTRRQLFAAIPPAILGLASPAPRPETSSNYSEDVKTSEELSALHDIIASLLKDKPHLTNKETQYEQLHSGLGHSTLRRKLITALPPAIFGLAYPAPHPDHSIDSSEELSLLQDVIASILRKNPHVPNKETYHKPLYAGYGYSTLHGCTIPTAAVRGSGLRTDMRQRKRSYEELNNREKNIFDVTALGEKGIAQFLQSDQSHLSPQKALNSGKYVGFMALVSPKNIGDKFLIFGMDDIKNPLIYPRFIGVGLVVDCFKESDWWIKMNAPYNHKGWDNIPWIADVSPEIMRQLPVGLSGKPAQINEGRPGTVMISEAFYKQLAVAIST